MPEPEHPPLGERISRAKAAYEKPQKQNANDADSTGATAGAAALRYGAEFGVSTGVGIGIGYVIDEVFGTAPWGLLIMMGFGLAAGILGVIRAYKELTAATNPANSSAEPDQEPNE